MKLRDILTKALYQNSTDDSYHMLIKFEDIDKIISEQEKYIKKFTTEFYEYMDDNYKRISDGFVSRISFDKEPIITIEKVLEDYENNKN